MASDNLTEYERRRLENIKRNNDMMASLKIQSHISDLSSSKRARQEKSYKHNPEKKSKVETPSVVRRSPRIQERPPNSDGLPKDHNNFPKMSSSSNKLNRLLVADLSLEQTYEGKGSHLALLKKLSKIMSKFKLNDEKDHSDSPSKFESVILEEPVELCSLKLESDNQLQPCSLKLDSDVVPQKITRNKKLVDQNDYSETLTVFERVKVEESIDPQPLKLEFDDTACVIPRSTIKTKSDDKIGHSNNPKKFERVKLDEIDPGSLKLEHDNIARVAPGKILSIRFFPTAEMTMVVVGNKDGHLGFWDVKPQFGEEEDAIHLYQPHSAPISGISVHPFTLSEVYSSSFDGILRMMNVEREKFELVYSSTYGSLLYSLAQQPNDANSLYFGEGPGGLNKFDVRTRNVSSCWPLHENRINSIDFCPTNTHMMATSSTDGFACIWDLRNMKDIKINDKHRERKALWTVKHARPVHSAYFSPSGSCLATTSVDDNIGVLYGSNFEDAFMIPHDNQTNRWVSSFRAVWGWDDTHLFIGNMKRRVDVLSVAQKRTVHTLESSNMSAVTCRYDAHPCNVGMLAGATSEGQVYIWTSP